MDFERNLESLEDIFSFIDSFAVENRVGRNKSRSIKLVSEELFTNFLKYNRGGGDKVRITLDRDGDAVFLRMSDYEVLSFEEPADIIVDNKTELENRKVGGLGVHLIKHLTRELTYDYRNGTLEVLAVFEAGKDDV